MSIKNKSVEQQKCDLDGWVSYRLDERTKNAIGEILSKEWKRQSFRYVAEESMENDEMFITGYRLYKKFEIKSLNSAYNFVHKMESYKVFRYPVEGGNRKVRTTDLGKQLYSDIKSFL